MEEKGDGRHIRIYWKGGKRKHERRRTPEVEGGGVMRDNCRWTVRGRRGVRRQRKGGRGGKGFLRV